MKLNEISDKAIAEGQLTDRSQESIIKWVIENSKKEYLHLFVSAIYESKLCPVKGLSRLENSNFFIMLANSYALNEQYNEATLLFEAMFKKGCNEPTMLNDYGAALLNQMIVIEKVDIDKLGLARKLIFEAFDFNKKYEYPAYENLCFLRNMEARYYYAMNEDLTAFLLGWMSIEMTVNRIGFQHFKRLDNTSKAIDKLSKVDNRFNKAKPTLDALRMIRNDLLHGKINNPTHDESKSCIDIGYQLIQGKG